jgi:hypothetical protein
MLGVAVAEMLYARGNRERPLFHVVAGSGKLAFQEGWDGTHEHANFNGRMGP